MSQTHIQQIWHDTDSYGRLNDKIRKLGLCPYSLKNDNLPLLIENISLEDLDSIRPPLDTDISMQPSFYKILGKLKMKKIRNAIYEGKTLTPEQNAYVNMLGITYGLKDTGF